MSPISDQPVHRLQVGFAPDAAVIPASVPTQGREGVLRFAEDTRGTMDYRGLLLGLMLVASSGALVWQVVTPQTIQFAGLTIDRLSTVLGVLVAAVGSVCHRFSIRYLDGDPKIARFLNGLLLTVMSAFVLMFSTHLILLTVSWAMTSWGLHLLLTHYPERLEGIRAAKKKFLISRLGDLALVTALVVIWWNWNTLDLHRLLGLIAAEPVTGPATLVAVLLVLAALTKSAQFPFHSWLPETMESPTPVSALMHAGVINAGGALLLRASPLIVRVPEALLLLSAIGTLTMVLGTLAMWAQVKVKRTLAWSTVSQMGFMIVQCGLAAFPAALLHIIAHGCYKAWSFLRSGELPSQGDSVPSASPGQSLTIAAIGVVAALPAMALATACTGFSPIHSSGEMAISAVLALAVSQLSVALLRGPGLRAWSLYRRVVLALILTQLGILLAFGLYRAAGSFLLPVLGDPFHPQGPAAWVAASLPIAALILLTIWHALLPVSASTAWGRSFRVHALHGFYLGVIADRLVAAVWRTPLKQGASHA